MNDKQIEKICGAKLEPMTDLDQKILKRLPDDVLVYKTVKTGNKIEVEILARKDTTRDQSIFIKQQEL